MVYQIWRTFLLDALQVRRASNFGSLQWSLPSVPTGHQVLAQSFFSCPATSRSVSQLSIKPPFEPLPRLTTMSTAINPSPSRFYSAKFPPPPVQKQGVPGVENVIVVASAKGGVGKSTTAVNLAVALASACGLRVGLLDADVYGPSLPRLMNLRNQPRLDAAKRMIPLENYGVRCMSMGFLMDDDVAAVWRGPMVMSALDRLLRGTAWGPLDVLVVDMPPGTGDAQISISQMVPLAGAVVVTTPQDLALIDARRGVKMFEKVDVPVLGVVENMSFFLCPSCGERAHIFGHGGARAAAQELGLDFLGEVPLQLAIRETSDDGRPIVASQPSGEAASLYAGIARKVAAKLASRKGGGEDGSSRPPTRIVVE